MKQGRKQAKDLDDRVVLAKIREMSMVEREHGYGPPYWVMSWELADAFGVDMKLMLAKARALITRKLLSGCPCGCRGDFELTTDGKAFLDSKPREQPQAASSSGSGDR